MELEKEDIQGLVRYGYPGFIAKYFLVQIADTEKAKKYLLSILDQVNTSAKFPDNGFALQLAFTCTGVKAMRFPENSLHSFPREFTEGIHLDPRPFILGYENANEPHKWQWGGPENDAIDCMILAFAKLEADMDAFSANQISNQAANGLKIVKIQDTVSNADEKEHFGFRDGISNPIPEGISESRKTGDISKAGEFVLGYDNDYGTLTTPPTVTVEEDPTDQLPFWSEALNLKDIGKNGTFLVYQQMSQDVKGFWNYLEKNSNEPVSDSVQAAVHLGAKMVGRWPNGNALILHPDAEGTIDGKTPANVFGYWNEDRIGTKCPLGAHVRRTNPRDWIPTETKQDMSAEMVRKHRLLRRGRAYGKPLVESMDPKEILAAPADSVDRGLHFICLVANINYQFEFVMNSWVRSPNFAGLFKDADPIIGTRNTGAEYPNDEFTCPVTNGLRRKYKELPQFTTVVGGAYFFLPGIKALKYLLNC